eukprot:GGOE01044759.1.p1 GENE.GGOE01044759.1~~GGOE01044759.1.p1  ORF type:complete len:1221 (-),score=464.12 GGOE01044759.1:614-4276(-)
MSREFSFTPYEQSPPRHWWQAFQHGPEEFPDNNIVTSRYSWATFIPVNLWEQFHVLTYVYYLVVSILQGTPVSPVDPVAYYGLLMVLLVNMFKDGYEDLQRHKGDRHINESKTVVLDTEGAPVTIDWQDVQVGNVVLLTNGDQVPADVIILGTCDTIGGFCYIETSNLDGETNLKSKAAVEISHRPLSELGLGPSEASAEVLRWLLEVRVECEEPNRHLELFTGTLFTATGQLGLSNQNVIYRGCTVRNTKWVCGLVTFTGMETKLMQNSMEKPLKRSTLERQTDHYTIVVLVVLVILLLLTTIMAVWWSATNDPPPWYLNSIRAWYNEIWAQPLASLCIYCWVVPLFLNVDMQVIKLVHIIFINNDPTMVYTDPTTGIVTHARTQSSGLVEDMGQIQYVFSDKTGTLTQNVMEFIKCSIAGVTYGTGTSPVARGREGSLPSPFATSVGIPLGAAAAAGLAVAAPPSSPKSPFYSGPPPGGFVFEGGSNFYDSRLCCGAWRQRPQARDIERFFLHLALCHSVISQPRDGDEGDSEAWRPDNLIYQASSPDEEALVCGAKGMGFTFLRRSYKQVTIQVDGESEPLHFEVLNTNEFSSSRKRMSIVIRGEDGALRVLCKGADSVMFELLDPKLRHEVTKTQDHINQFAKEGLRTLVLGERELTATEYEKWDTRFQEASMAQANREELLEGLAIELERDFELLGATASEDKLQDGVPQCIRTLRLAGIQVWVLTGDKVDTAVTIATSCNLLDSSMQVTRITSPDPPRFLGVEEKNRWMVEGRTAVLQQFEAANSSQAAEDRQAEGVEALVIDGVSLARALELEEEWKEEDGPLLQFCCRPACRVVVACRVSPKQKAEVVTLVKSKKKKITLAIGDGANDVGMIQQAHIGVGISGKEGAQAVLASDFSIPQFRFLEQLLLIHGRWAFQRLSILILYSFARVIGWTLCNFFFTFDIAFSSAQFWDNFFAGQWTSFFTSVASYAVCITNRDFQYQSTLLAMPELYGDVQNGRPFRPTRFYWWMVHSVWIGVVCYYIPMWALVDTTASNGLDNGFWFTSYTAFAAICIAVNMRLLLEVQSMNAWIAGGFFFSFVAYWLFGVAYTSLPPWFQFLFLKPANVYWMFYVQFVNWATWAVILLAVLVSVAPLMLVKFWKASMEPVTRTEVAQRREYRIAKEQARMDRRLTEDQWRHLLVLQKQRDGTGEGQYGHHTPANTSCEDFVVQSLP